MTEIRINSWNELQDALFQGAWRQDMQRFRSPFAFRGVSLVEYALQPSLALLGGDYAAMERHLIRNFRKYARQNDLEHDTLWDWLSLAKHHGLPTRLLDWSYSPYVALHFATAHVEHYHLDGVVWAMNYVGVKDHLPDKLRHKLKKEGSDVLTVSLLHEAAPTLEDFDQLTRHPFVAFFEPPSIDQRIVNQYALFSLMSNPTARLDEWLSQHPDLFFKIILPASFKWEIRDKLDQANITERVLFPGLDGLSAWLARQYTTRK